MFTQLSQRIKDLFSTTKAEQQWKTAFNQVFGEGKRPDSDPASWQTLCSLEQRYFPGRLVEPLAGFLRSHPTSPLERKLFSSYLQSSPSIDPRLGAIVRNLTDPRANPDEESRFWAWETVFRHRLHIGHFGRLVEPMLRHESQPMTVLLVAQMLQSAPENPATTAFELSPARELLRERLQKLEKQLTSSQPPPSEQTAQFYLASWEMRVALSHHVPDENLVRDFHRVVHFFPHGETLAAMFPLIHKAPPELSLRLKKAAVDGLLQRLHTHPDLGERASARALCINLSSQISPQTMMCHLLDGFSSGHYALTENNAMLLHDLLFPETAPFSNSFCPLRLPPNGQMAAAHKVWELTVQEFFKCPVEIGEAHRKLLVSLQDPTQGRTLSDLIRQGLGLHPAPPGLHAQLAELIPRLGTSIERCELWETMVRQLPENRALGPALAELTRRLPMRELVNHIIHHQPQLPPQAAALTFNWLLPVARETPLTHETPSRVALRQLWEQLPTSIQKGFQQRHRDVSLLVADPQPLSPGESTPELTSRDNPQRDPSPFLSIPPTPGQSPHMRLGEIWERFLPVAATNIARWGPTLYEVQRAVPDGEICRRLGQEPLQRNIRQDIDLTKLILYDLYDRVRAAGNAHRREQMEKTIQQLLSARPTPADQNLKLSGAMATSKLPSLPTQQFPRPSTADFGRA